MVHPGIVRLQQVVDTSVAKAPTGMGNFHDLAAQVFCHLIDLGRVAIAVTGEPHKPARAALRQIALLDHHGDSHALGLRG